MPSDIFRKDISKYRGQLRCRHHDYHSVCIYMVTIKKHPETPFFCSISDSGSRSGGKIIPLTTLTPTGTIINSQLERLKLDFPFVRVLCRAIMPDHYHILIYITEKSAKSLGEIVNAFKSYCTAMARSKGLISPDASFFEKGFNDLICRRAGQKETFYKYICDNPYRLLVRQLYPGYFRRTLQLAIGEERYAIYGNIQLLQHPLKAVVRFSRRYSEERLASLNEEWDEIARQGGILVSPFIHAVEKAALNRSIEQEARFIKIYTNGLPERFKPHKSEFELMEAGRLLIVAPERFDAKKSDNTRADCMRANEVAERIVKLNPGDYRLKRI